jgi:hypothetical protein
VICAHETGAADEPEAGFAGREASRSVFRSPALKEGARGGTMGSPALNEWGYSCRLVDLIGELLP